MKRQTKMRIWAWLLTVCLCLGMLPADMFGGISSVQAETTTETPTSWNFGEMTSEEAINSTTGTYKGIVVDATNGKLSPNGDKCCAQFNTGTVLQVPVDGACSITVTPHNGEANYALYTINGTAASTTESSTTVEYTGGAGYVDIVSTGSAYISTIVVTPKTTSGPEEKPATPTVHNGKIDVWDFGAEQLDAEGYNNMLTVDIINNNFYSGVTAGTKGVNLASFTYGDLSFNDGGSPTSHRLRSTNASISRYDEKSLAGSDGNTYTGYVYSNSGSSKAVYIGLQAEAGDILTYWVGSNGGVATYGLETPSGKVLTGEFTNAAKLEPLTFYATEDGTYKLYCTNEKLVVGRIYRQHTEDVAVSGAVTAPAALTDYSIVFTNKSSGAVTEAAVTNGAYSATLKDSYSYNVSLKDANGYVITSAASLDLAKGAEDTTFAVTVEAVSLYTVSGEIQGLPDSQIANAKITYNANMIYVPKISVTGNTYTVKLEKGVEYALEVAGVNDYTLISPTKLEATADGQTVNLVFEAKPVYKVTIDPTGATVEDLANATFTFTNLNEEGYVYTFTGTDDIELRDGVYSVEVKNSGIFVQKLTSNLKVSGAAVTKKIGFDSDITEWVFTGDDYTGQSTYNGLTISGGGKHGAQYGMQIKNGTIEVPVAGSCEVLVSVGYNWDISFDDGTVSYFDNTNSGDRDVAYSYTGEAGTVTINVGSQCTSYIKKIKLVYSVPYKETVTVGATGCDYTSINDALDAVRGMSREEGQRVTIAIEPGNYEEMLVVDVPNVTLKNASSNPSIELTNKGVDIAKDAVRITSYYGHGYSYYSMGSDCKWDEEILAVNKENGYESFTNPGSGSTAGSYWNATVVVSASGFEADGIIFENSFNQYVSEKAANDVIVAQTGAKEGSVARADMKAGDTTVQNKAYVERAAALAICNNVKEVSFDNCKFVGRQDTLYGGTGTTAAFYDCDIYGGTDYIFGPMTAVFAKCDLVFNTSEDKNDVGYITAPQQSSGRGYLMYNCRITSTIPGVDTASEYTSKPGYLGRPWKADTSEAVFYNTVIDATCDKYYEATPSMIEEAGWLNTLSGESALCLEYGTYEMAKAAPANPARASWSGGIIENPTLADGTEITVEAFLGDWDAFAGKDMEIVIPTDKVDNTPVKEEPEGGELKTYKFDVATLTAAADKEEIAEGTTFDNGYFKSIGSVTKRYNGTKVTSVEVGKNSSGSIQFTVEGTADVVIEMSSTGGSNDSAVALVDASDKVIDNAEGVTTVKGTSAVTMTYKGLEAGTYRVVSPTSDYNRGARLYTIEVEDYVASSVVINDYEFDVATLTAAADKEAIAEGTTFDNGYFKSIGSVTKRYNGTKVTSVEVGKNSSGSIQFTVEGTADVIIEMSSTGGSNDSAVALVDASDKVINNTEGVTTVKGTSAVTMTYKGLGAGTYKVVSPTSDYNRGARLYTIKVSDTVSGSRPARAEWSTVAAPAVMGATVGESDITVSVAMNIGYDGADSVRVEMQDAEGSVVDKKSYAAEGTTGTVKFTPSKSGVYTFVAYAIRGEEAEKASNALAAEKFILPLTTPYVNAATSVGGGAVVVEWDEVVEAEKYIVTVEGTEISVESTTLKAEVTGLTVGQKYTFKVVAVRGEDVSEAGSKEATVAENAQRKWSFSTFGSSINTKQNGYIGEVNDGSVTIYSEGGKGKHVPGSTDGLAFYYTAIEPETENFTLTATVAVDSWTLSNGQEGFGLMAADAVGPNGNSTAFWNNSYQNAVGKIEYYHDGEAVTSDSTASKISMKLGLGTVVRTGTTAADVADIAAGKISMPVNFVSQSTTLETSCAKHGAGTYNIIGNYTGAEPTGTQDEVQTSFRMQLQRNNTGYILRYLDMNDNVIGEKLYYDLERDSLTQIDKDNIYVGFFAARNARITVTDVELTTIAPEDDDPAEEREIEYVLPVNTIESATFSNSADYELVYYGNADGQLIITDVDDKEIVNKAFTALTKERVKVTLKDGFNNFTVKFVPDKNYVPGEYKEMSSYETVTIPFVVEYKTSSREVIYVGPNGKTGAAGTKSAPMDIYSAVKIVAPGQKIVLLEGTYNLKSTVKVERGIDGTADKMIYMIADTDASTRPVLDFGKNCAGMVLAGDYWYFQGFDVTNSADAQKGIQVSGNNNTLDNLRTYRNGNTGIQISRYKGTDQWEDWPADNLILNCTSYLNADKGYEDADGFAAKLTVADGNVFDGCIAAYNADDGWDLFAKVQTGSIGVVTIKNSVAFKNGYVVDADGNEVKAGNGNGFKMGGDSMPGAHVIENSIAFANKAKGLDTNSGPDVQMYNCTSFDNESYNVALYTNTAKNTAYKTSGIVSYKKSNTVGESIKPVGSQVEADIYGSSNYYYNDGKSVNTQNKQVTDDWFVNLDTEAAITGITRNADGTINMNGYLELTDVAASDAGARMTGTASDDVEIPEDTTGGDDTTDSEEGGSSSSDSSSSADSDDDDDSSSSEDTTIDWTEVETEVKEEIKAAVSTAPAQGDENVNLNFTSTGETKVPTEVLSEIKGENVTVAFQTGNGVALSISGDKLKGVDLNKVQNVDLTVNHEPNAIPDLVVASKGAVAKKELSIKDTGNFGVAVDMHINVGKENAGKVANLYRYNPTSGQLEFCSHFVITAEGQSMFAIARGGDYLITVTNTTVNETTWYFGGDYTVQAGDNLSKIAVRYHMPLAELIRRNPQLTNLNLIRPGQKLRLN